jgi:hypothetical protein
MSSLLFPPETTIDLLVISLKSPGIYLLLHLDGFQFPDRVLAASRVHLSINNIVGSAIAAL